MSTVAVRSRGRPTQTSVRKFSDGHKIMKDELQWIVRHPRTCKFAHSLRSDPREYASETFHSFNPMFRESTIESLKMCGIYDESLEI